MAGILNDPRSWGMSQDDYDNMVRAFNGKGSGIFDPARAEILKEQQNAPYRPIDIKPMGRPFEPKVGERLPLEDGSRPGAIKFGALVDSQYDQPQRELPDQPLLWSDANPRPDATKNSFGDPIAGFRDPMRNPANSQSYNDFMDTQGRTAETVLSYQQQTPPVAQNATPRISFGAETTSDITNQDISQALDFYNVPYQPPGDTGAGQAPWVMGGEAPQSTPATLNPTPPQGVIGTTGGIDFGNANAGGNPMSMGQNLGIPSSPSMMSSPAPQLPGMPSPGLGVGAMPASAPMDFSTQSIPTPMSSMPDGIPTDMAGTFSVSPDIATPDLDFSGGDFFSGGGFGFA